MQTSTDSFLNVTLLAAGQKHPTIFRYFDELKEGECLIIQNDHDPKPLYYQLIGKRGNIFRWEYIERGPTRWEIKISKRLSGEAEETIGEIAATDLRKAEVFKKYGIDFCCGGKKTVREACDEKGLDITKIEYELSRPDTIVTGRPLPYNEWTPDFLSDYIVNMHHSYVRNTLPDLRSLASKVSAVHKEQHPELEELAKLVEEIAEELYSHMIKEEKVLFPYVKQLVLQQESGLKAHTAAFGTVQNPINMMEMEHEQVGEALARIRQITGDYKLPDDACASYTMLFNKLQEFESDLFIHIHLENNILFPKALEIETNLN